MIKSNCVDYLFINKIGLRNAELGCYVHMRLSNMQFPWLEIMKLLIRGQILSMILANHYVFVDADGTLGLNSSVKHRIDTGDSHPIKLPPYRASFAQKELIEKELDVDWRYYRTMA